MLSNLAVGIQLIWTAGLGATTLIAAAPSPKRRYLFQALVIAVPTAVLLSYFRWALGGRELLESIVAAAVVFSFALNLIASKIKNAVWQNYVQTVTLVSLGYLLPQAALWNLVRWPFQFSLLSAAPGSFLDSQLLGQAAGLALGLALPLGGLVALGFAEQTWPEQLRYKVMLAVVAIYTLKHLVTLGQILTALGIWSPGILFGFLIWAINLLPQFPNLLLFLGLGLPILGWFCTRQSLYSATHINPALRRKITARNLYKKQLTALTVTLLAIGVSFSIYKEASAKPLKLSPAVPVTAEEGTIKIPLRDLDDGKLHRYSFAAPDGVSIRFIALNKGGKLYGTGLDYCNFCGTTGYVQKGDKVVCINCDVVINRVTIGFPGGCNPVPLPSKVDGNFLVIEAKELLQYQDEFAQGS